VKIIREQSVTFYTCSMSLGQINRKLKYRTFYLYGEKAYDRQIIAVFEEIRVPNDDVRILI